MSRVERDPERGRAAAAKLKALGATRILIKAAEQGYITQLACKMPECFCPEELGGACYFEPVATKSDWIPTHEHFPLSKKDGGRRAVDNAILAHRLCNRLDYSIRVGRSYARDLERIRKAREEATRRKATVEAIDESGEPVEETEPEAEGATPKPKKTKKEPELKSLPDAEKAQYLLDHPTISDLDERASAQGREARRLHPSHPARLGPARRGRRVRRDRDLRSGRLLRTTSTKRPVSILGTP